MNLTKTVCCLTGVFMIAFSSTSKCSENLLKNGLLDMKPGEFAPTGWTGDKLPKELVKSGILATLNQAVRIEVKEANKQNGYIYQYISPKDGFKQPYILLNGYVKSSIKGGAFFQVKMFKGKKLLKIVNAPCTITNDWQLVKQTFPLEDADRIQVLCRYYRNKKYIGNTVEFGDISLTTTDKSLNANEFKDKKIKIVVLGDSTVQTYAQGSVVAGWGQVIQNYFNKNVGVRNRALSGKSSKTFIQQGLLDKALKDKADYAFVQFGHNDSHGKNRPESTDAKTDFKEYLRVYVKKLNATGTKVIFVTPMCRMTFSKDGTLRDNLQPYADAMKEVAKKQNCPLIDLHEASRKFFTTLGPEKCKELCTGRPKDRTHFSLKGANAMAKLIIQELKKTNIPLAEYIKK